MNITVETTAGDTVLTDNPPRQYYRLRYDWDPQSQYSGKLRSAAPCPGILNFQQMQHNWMNAAWQRFWFSLNRTDDYSRDVRAWNTYTNSQAFLTDATGTDKYRNYIADTHIDQPYPKIESKGCVGNVVCIVEDPAMMAKGYAQIETININNPPPVGMTYKSHPHLIHHATNITSGASGYVCNPFTHLGGRNTGIPIYFPVTSKSPVYYPIRYLQKLAVGAPVPNPYTPPML